METIDTILNELKELAPVVTSLKKRDVYTVPDRYFDEMPDILMEKIGAGSLKITSLFTVPQGYFNNLSSGILSKIKSSPSEVYQELEETAPLLNTISRQNIYTVPDNYFEGLKVTPPQKPKATILSFSNTRKWISYAAAAVMAGILVTGAFMYTYRPASFDLAKEVNKLSDEELDNYINSERSSVVFSPDSINLGSEVDVQSDLKLISDEELQQYLQDNQEVVPTTSHKGS